jgi:DNA-binding response OmpR family regulator
MASERILIIDDDENIDRALEMFFRHEGISSQSCYSGKDGLETAANQTFDLILLDLDMPDIDGFAVIERLRSCGDTTPVIIISGHDEEYNKLIGLGSGADDYVTKPFSMPLLLSKVRALIRRNVAYAGTWQAENAGSTNSGDILKCGPFELNRSTYRLSKNGKEIDLTARELALLTVFMEHPGQVFSKIQLYEAVWDNDLVDENTVMVYVKRLRDKIEDDSSNPKYLLTKRGIGYYFAEPAQ